MTKKDKKLEENIKKENLKEYSKEMKDFKKKIDEFKKKIVKKFDKTVIGIGLVPPFEKLPNELKGVIASRSNLKEDLKKEEVEKMMKDKIQLIVVGDDSTSEKLPKEKLLAGFEKSIRDIASEVDEKINAVAILHSEWAEGCYHSEYEISRLVAISNIVYDRGFFFSAIKVAETHKQMVLETFEKYIVSYVLVGSFVQGNATEKSDFDVMVIVDDTDVKKMTRYELKEKLRNMIIGMGIQAGEMTGIKGKLHIQVYILTDFWDSVKDANPVIFSMLRDGVSIYDKGLFLPWKQLLRMGKVRPSRESITVFKSMSKDLLNRIDMKIKDIAQEDLFYTLLNPMQAALMQYGVNPTTPRETLLFAEEFFVNDEKILKKEDLELLDNVFKLRKKLEYGEVKKVSLSKLNSLVRKAKKYVENIDPLFEKIDQIKQKEDYLKYLDNLITKMRSLLEIRKVSISDVIKNFEKEFVTSGLFKKSDFDKIKKINLLETKAKENELTDVELDKVKKDTLTISKKLDELFEKLKTDIARMKLKKGITGKETIEFLKGKDKILLSHQNKYKELKLNKKNKIAKEKEISKEEFEKILQEIEPQPLDLEILDYFKENFKDFKLI